jgi:hypothetical protein
MMQRTLDGQFLTSLANDVLVRPALGGEGVLDLMPVVADPNNYALVEDGLGGFVYLPLYEGVYEVHTIFRRGVSPRKVAALAARSLEYMFVNTLTQAVVTKVPDDNRGADWLVRQCGFSPLGRRNDAWKPGVGITYWKLDLDGWMKACSTLEEWGRAFHGTLERAKIEAGSQLGAHADDGYHDRAVGAAVSMIKAGNTVKGVDTYNKWAILAGYAPAVLVSLQPFVVDIYDAILGLVNGEIEVLQCR